MSVLNECSGEVGGALTERDGGVGAQRWELGESFRVASCGNYAGGTEEFSNLDGELSRCAGGAKD